MAGLARRFERSMSSAQPGNGLPERRMITADSVRALKLKLAGANRPAAEPSVAAPDNVESEVSEEKLVMPEQLALASREPVEPASMLSPPSQTGLVERRVLEKPQQPEDAAAGARAHALLDIMAIPTEGSLP